MNYKKMVLCGCVKFSKSQALFGYSKMGLSQLVYEMPQKYRDCFYLANASFFDSTHWFLHRAYEVVYGDLVEELKNRKPHLSDDEADEKIRNTITLLEPVNTVVDTTYPIKRENGNFSLITAYRVHHGGCLNAYPRLGGLRIHPDITKDHFRALAALSTYRYACMGIGMSGSAGGIKIYPKDFSQNEYQSIIEKYATEMASMNICGESIDVIEPEVGSSSIEMSWIANSDSKLQGSVNINKPCAVGKPQCNNGIENYEKVGSHCVHFGLNYFLNHDDIAEKICQYGGLENKTFILIGLGRLAESVAFNIENSGAKCVGVKDIDAYVYEPKGISIAEILAHKKNTGSIQNFNLKTQPYENDSIFSEACDILVLASKQKSLVYCTADKVKANVILEVAHGSITPSAHKILIGHKKLVIPDIYISGGYSLASYYEYLKNTQLQVSRTFSRSYAKDVLQGMVRDIQSPTELRNSVLKLQEAQQESEQNVLIHSLEHIMEHTARDILKIAENYNLNLDLRTAAYIKAVKHMFRKIFDNQK